MGADKTDEQISVGLMFLENCNFTVVEIQRRTTRPTFQ